MFASTVIQGNLEREANQWSWPPYVPAVVTEE
jgi:hypothetical protein